MRQMSVLAAVGTMCIAAVSQLNAQIDVGTRRPDVIRGRVTTDSGVPVAGAEVIAVRAPDRAFKSATTDEDGRYEIVWSEGTGDYLLHFAALGRKSLRKRVMRSADDSVLQADASLEPSVQRIATVTVEAEKPKPQRSGALSESDVGAAENITDGVLGSIPPDLGGDLINSALTAPGVLATAQGISVLGLNSSQNSTTLNGLAFGASDIPADINSRIHVVTSSYDPARGWFSGANTEVEIDPPGGFFSQHTAHAVIDAPPLQWADRLSSRLGQRFTNIQLGAGGNGPIDEEDRFFYNFGLQGSHRSSDLPSLLDEDSDLLHGAGVSIDSARRLIQILQSTNSPALVATGPTGWRGNDFTGLLRVDHAPYNWQSFEPAKATWALTAYAKLARADAVDPASSVTTTPSHGGSGGRDIGSLQAMYSFYFGNDWLEDARTSVTSIRSWQQPLLDLPSGRVLVRSEFEDDIGALQELQFGGNSALAADMRQWTWETASETQFYPSGKAQHRVKLNLDWRLDRFSREARRDLGVFSFNSLVDLSANRPSSFVRTLDSPPSSGGVWNAFVALGDLWRVSRGLQVIYGARFEANAFTQRARYNSEVHRLFGRRTDDVPNTVHISPRVGFTWNRSGDGGGVSIGRLGRFNLGSRSSISGGIGEFRNLFSASLLSDVSTFTGLPGDNRELTCVGSAVPLPDWSSFAADPQSVPTQCLDGAPAMIDSAPAVHVLNPRYTAPHSWRANLAYTSSWARKLSYTVEAVYSLNLNQPGGNDLNFRGSPQFTLSDEGRPVYVTREGIDASTGAVSTTSARRTNRFGAVIDHVSDLRSVSKQATLTLRPDFWNRSGKWYMSLAYTLSSIRENARGFDGATFADPRDRTWTRGALDARHQLRLQSGIVAKGVAITLFGRFMSGLPFTPIVASDINGDGLTNDRAYLFDPRALGDSAFRSDLATLYSSLPKRVGRCIAKQLAKPAARNSCEGPWTAVLNIQLTAPGSIVKLARIGSITLNLTNPLAGLDHLLHGPRRLHGWGSQLLPDPVIYSVRGFDSTTSRFQYDVNPRFGSTHTGELVSHAPFRVTLAVAVPLGADVSHQQLYRVLRPGRAGHGGERLSVEALKKRYTRTIPDYFGRVLAESDSLFLSKDQEAALANEQSNTLARLDSVWTELATYLSALPDAYNVSEAYRRQEAAIDSAGAIAWELLRNSLPKILTPDQLRLLPNIQALIRMKQPPRYRTYRG